MQRRTTQRSSSAKNSQFSYSSSQSTGGGNDKNKGRKIRFRSLFQLAIIFFFAVFCIGVFLTPSQKNELIKAEHQLEVWLESGPKEEKHEMPNEEEGDRTTEQGTDPPENAKPNRASSDATTARTAAQPSRWIDGEKALKKKLKVLYDQQEKGQYLSAPVLTRYLGEEIPAFVGTPDSTMKEEEWKKLVEAKYKEMREEEEEWQKKMSLLIEKRERDIGITTP